MLLHKILFTGASILTIAQRTCKMNINYLTAIIKQSSQNSKNQPNSVNF